MKSIWFDMDGTIANLYGTEDWLTKILAENTEPYEQARPLINMQSLARVLNRLRRAGYSINVVSWLSKGGSLEYGERVKQAKILWLRKHLTSVVFDRIDIIPYGEPKHNGRYGILFDDEQHNRECWQGVTYDVDNIINTLKALQ